MGFESETQLAIHSELITFETEGTEISQWAAKIIASWWHSPAAIDAPITLLSHTGKVTIGVLAVIDRNIGECEEEFDVKALKALRAYADSRIPWIKADDVGTWLDGAMGWHNTYRVIDLAIARGFTIDDTDRAALDRYRRDAALDSLGDCENVQELSEQATDYLQELAPDGYVFEWDCGDLSLLPESEVD